MVEWGLSHEDNRYKLLALKAMEVGLRFGQFNRSSGGEKQGTKHLVDYSPNGVEIHVYWENILKKLTHIILSNNDLSNYAESIFVNGVRFIFMSGNVPLALKYVDQISVAKQFDWDEIRKSLLNIMKYQADKLSKVQNESMNALVGKLTRNDFKSRFIRISKPDYFFKEETYSSERAIQIMEELSIEFIANKLPLNEYIELFCTSAQYYGCYFGKNLIKLYEDNKELINDFISMYITTLTHIPKELRGVSILEGFINEANISVKEEFYKQIVDNKDLRYLIFQFVSLNPDGKKYFNLLYSLVDSGEFDLYNFEVLSHGNALRHSDITELINFSEHLFLYGPNGYMLVLEMYFNLCFNNEGLKLSLLSVFIKCITNIPFSPKSRSNLDYYKWSQIIEFILTKVEDNTFAIFVNSSFINSMTFDNEYHLDHYVKDIYKILIQKYFNSIWQDLSVALLATDAEYAKFFSLKNIIGSSIGSMNSEIGILFDGNTDQIFEWCHAFKPLAPIRIAELVPIFADNNSNYSLWHPLFLRMINCFGDIEEVLNTLENNMGTYSWMGSMVPFLKSKKELLATLLDHKFINVSNWAQKTIGFLNEEIRYETKRNEELYI